MSERTPKTPNTSVVKEGWRRGHPFPLVTEPEERSAEFDRWLSKHEVEVAEAERERIIYILENIPPGSGVGGDDLSLAVEIINGKKFLEDMV